MSAKKKTRMMSGYLKKMKRINQKMLLVANNVFGVDSAIMKVLFRKIMDTKFDDSMWGDEHHSFEHKSRTWIRQQLYQLGLTECSKTKVQIGERKVKSGWIPVWIPVFRRGYSKWEPDTYKLLDHHEITYNEQIPTSGLPLRRY